MCESLCYFYHSVQQKCPSGSVGFVGNLGLCKCKVTSLDDICNRECRNSQKNRIVLMCTDPPKLRITFPNQAEVILLSVL